jgi:hypothetical protein
MCIEKDDIAYTFLGQLKICSTYFVLVHLKGIKQKCV